MIWMLVLAFAAMAFIAGCSIGGLLGWLDRYAAARAAADEPASSRASGDVKAA